MEDYAKKILCESLKRLFRTGNSFSIPNGDLKCRASQVPGSSGGLLNLVG